MKTKRYFLFTNLFLLLGSLLGFVHSQLVPLEETLKTDRWSVQEPDDQRKILKVSRDPLLKAGINEALQDWDNCILNARQVSAKSIVKDWAQLLELTCATQLADPESKTKVKNTGQMLADSLRKIENSQSQIQNHTFLDKRKIAILNARLVLCRNFKKHARWKELRAELQKAFAQESEYSKNDRAELYEMAGEVLVAERQWTDAFNQLQRSHDLDPDSVQTDVRIRALLPMVSPQIREQFEARIKAANQPSVAAPATSTEELEIVSQAESFLTRSDPVSAVEAMTKLIHKYPGGLKAKWAQDKIFELLSAEIEKSKGPNGPSVIKRKILSYMNDFDPDRELEWGKSLFDIQMYGDAAPLLTRAAQQSAGSAKASKAFYLAGRAYQLSNDYGRAKDMFQVVLKSYPASPEVTDAAIQWGLININENDPSEAITHLEVARSRHMTNQQDLVSLFWLYESYKMKKTDAGVTDAAGDLIKRFGLTYYGIIAYQDVKKSLPQYPKDNSKSAKVYFSIQETQAIARARALMASGLFDAAAEELSIFANRPLSPEEEQYILNFYAQSVHHQKAFALLSTLFDDNPDKKTEPLVKKLFPKEFWDLVNNDKMRADLDPFLLLSVMKQESAFDKNAVSHSGALGLLQMIPPTAQEVKQELKSNEDVPSALTDPATNVRYCAYYLARLIKKYEGSVPLALAAYNAGPMRISQFINAKGGAVRDTWVDELPWSETSFYVKSILKNYVMYRILYGGLTQLPVPPWAITTPVSASPSPASSSARQ